MSRTKRSIKYANLNARSIKFKSQLTKTLAFIDELSEYSFVPRTRDRILSNRGYLNNWDDHKVSAYHELDFKDGKNTDFDCAFDVF